MTQKTIKKKQKNKKSGKFREIIKTEERLSFFKFFKDTAKVGKKILNQWTMINMMK